MPVTAPPRRQPPQEHKGGEQHQQPLVPFTRASRRGSQLAFDVSGTLGTSAVNLGPIELPPSGFLRYIELIITIVSAGNSATVAFNADAPWNALSLISLANTAGDTALAPVDGYKLFLINKYGGYGPTGNTDDPRRDPNNSTTTGSGGTGGTATFVLRIPVETSPRDALTALANGAANKLYRLNLQTGTLATIYATAPTVAPTIRVRGIAHYWTAPLRATAAGHGQQVHPNGNGSVQYWRIDTPAVASGDKYVKINNVGNVIRMIVFVLRDSSNVRIGASTDWPDVCQVFLDNNPLLYLQFNLWKSAMARAYGLSFGAALDAAGGLDTGVFVIHQFNDMMGGVTNWGLRDQWLPTLDGTLLQIRGTNFGANAATLEILTNEIKPISGAALYG